MIQKLKQQKGETLIESMMSLLIALVCMSILTLSVTTASKMNMETNRLDEKYFKDLQMAEQRLFDDGDYKKNENANVVITFADSEFIIIPENSSTVNVTVTIYGGSADNNAFAAYTKR